MKHNIEPKPTFYKIGCLMGHNSYVASSEGKQYDTEEKCQNAIANRIAEQQAPHNAFAVLKFVETEVIPASKPKQVSHEYQ